MQSAEIEEKQLRHYMPETEEAEEGYSEAAKYTLELLQEAKRPLLLVGQGMVSAGAQQAVRFWLLGGFWISWLRMKTGFSAARGFRHPDIPI